LTPNDLVSLLERALSFAVFALLFLLARLLLHGVILGATPSIAQVSDGPATRMDVRGVPQSGANRAVDEAVAVSVR
jgi:hypothetical protein